MEPLIKINNRVELAKQDSDVELFYDLMLAGEQLLKLVTLGVIACLEKDQSNNKYRLLHKVVRSEGLGGWVEALDDALIGPASSFWDEKAKDIQKELISNYSNPSWAYGAVFSLNKCIEYIEGKKVDIPNNINLRLWFNKFKILRNKTKGHGAPTKDVCSNICVELEKSINFLEKNLRLFKYSWAYLHRNISGKYRVSKISSNIIPFEPYKESSKYNFQNGVYLYINRPRYVELLFTDSNLTDFYYPNGGFNDKGFECLSYITGIKQKKDSKDYLTPTGELPHSETEGEKDLDVKDNCFLNVPNLYSFYINRTELEEDIEQLLIDDRHPVITLHGRGGIGKTSLALSVINRLTKLERYEIIVWFSARDIDLLENGAKTVTPNVLSEDDIAIEYVNLIDPSKKNCKKFNAKEYMESELSSTKSPTLFVMDNFETLKYPIDVYNWLDTFIRNPNKILITSRFREFKADYPIEVKGMKEKEFNLLVNETAKKLNIDKLINSKYVNELFQESGGHPYVAKVLMGEIAKSQKLGPINRIIAGKNEVLLALFERTYDNLSPAAQKTFLVLSNWRTIIPRLALESVIVKTEKEHIDIEEAIDELYRYSLIDLIKSEDNQYFIFVPLSSFEFGKQKLNVSHYKSSVSLITNILYLFGTTQYSEIKKGFRPKFLRFIKEIVKEIKQNKAIFNKKYKSIIEFICLKYNEGWLTVSELYEDLNDYKNAKISLQKYIQNEPNTKNRVQAWQKLSILNQITKDWIAEAHSIIEMCELHEVSFDEIDNSVSRLLNLLQENKIKIDTSEKEILVRRIQKIFKDRIEEGDLDSKTNLAWLHLHLKEFGLAKKIIKEVLKENPGHYHGLRLASKLKVK